MGVLASLPIQFAFSGTFACFDDNLCRLRVSGGERTLGFRLLRASGYRPEPDEIVVVTGSYGYIKPFGGGFGRGGGGGAGRLGFSASDCVRAADFKGVISELPYRASFAAQYQTFEEGQVRLQLVGVQKSLLVRIKQLAGPLPKPQAQVAVTVELAYQDGYDGGEPRLGASIVTMESILVTGVQGKLAKTA